MNVLMMKGSISLILISKRVMIKNRKKIKRSHIKMSLGVTLLKRYRMEAKLIQVQIQSKSTEKILKRKTYLRKDQRAKKPSLKSKQD